MPPESLEALREAGQIASAARNWGARRVVAGARLREVCEGVEDEIRRRGAGLAFPAQSSRNEIAAHYCASPEDDTVYADGDLAKLDIGVHVDGWVVDTATTVSVGDRPELRPILEAARAALEAAIAAVSAGVPVRRISATIETTIASYGLRPMRNLCGHGVGRWTVHGPPPIPNVADDSLSRLWAGSVVAIEPFATDGMGLVAEEGEPQVFRLDPGHAVAARPGAAGEALAAIQAFRGLPFARRQLAAFTRDVVEGLLDELLAEGALHGYAPLVEASHRPVAQAEHTLFVGTEGVEVLTR